MFIILQREYEEFRVGINSLVAKSRKVPEEGWTMQDGTPWPGNNVGDHPGMIQVGNKLRTDSYEFIYGLFGTESSHLFSYQDPNSFRLVNISFLTLTHTAYLMCLCSLLSN